MSQPFYIGRFAPSPSGPLHFGSLVAALASYLDARTHDGKWLVRMEDIDPPRESPEAATVILKALEAYRMYWDGDVLYQSSRSRAYQNVLDKLLGERQLYPCTCTRKDLSGLNGVYPGYCRERTILPEEPHSLRLKCPKKSIRFHDLIQGLKTFELQAIGDFILKRKDNLFSYQLAVSIDDAYQKITHVVRGYDLIDSTPRQIYLQNILGFPHPQYSHFPVITQAEGGKLSKQNRAPAIPLDEPRPLLLKALKALGLVPETDLSGNSVDEILQWAIAHWQLKTVPKKAKLQLSSLD